MHRAQAACAVAALVLATGWGVSAQVGSNDTLTIDALKRHVDDRHIRDVATLMSELPSDMKRNYVLMETSRTGRPSSARSPRVIMYRSDARLMAAIGTHQSDTLRDVVDLAELNPTTGLWRFRSLDFRQDPPVLSADDSACQRCHGSPARPIWSNYGAWPGAFGPDFDRLTASQASALNALLSDQRQAERLDVLDFYDKRAHYGTPYAPGDFFWLNRSYGYVNTVFGFELSTAVAEGVYQRMRNHPRYAALRVGFPLFQNGCDQRADRITSPVWQRFERDLQAAGARSPSQSELYRVLGVEPQRDFALGNLSSDAAKDDFWTNGEDSLFGLVAMLVLDDLVAGNQPLRQLLARTPEDPVFAVGEPNLERALAYRIAVGWRLRGEARQAQRQGDDFRLNTFRGSQGIFDPLGDGLCTTLFAASDGTPPPPPPPPSIGVWSGNLARQGSYQYLPNLAGGIRSDGRPITATLSGPANTEFRFLLISLDLYQVVASGTGAGNVKSISFTGPPGRYAWYVEAERGSGSFRIQGSLPNE